jgi:hypothetical protein
MEFLGTVLFVVVLVVAVVGAPLFFYWLDREREKK